MDPFLTEVAAVNFCYVRQLSSKTHFVRIHNRSIDECKKQTSRNHMCVLKPKTVEVIWKFGPPNPNFRLSSPKSDDSWKFGPPKRGDNCLIGIAYDKIGSTLSDIFNIRTIGTVTINELIMNKDLFDRYYPSRKIDSNTKNKIYRFMKSCARKGLGYVDGHPENITVDNNWYYLISTVDLK